MSCDFKRFEEDPTYPEDVKFIRKELEKSGTVYCSNKRLGELWRDFSDRLYDAGFLHPEPEFIEEFINFLDPLDSYY